MAKKTGEEILEDMKDAASTVVDAAKPVVEKAARASQKAVKAGAGAAQKAAKAGADAAQKAVDSARKSTPKKPEYYVQFAGREVSMTALADLARAQFREANKRTAVMSCRIYLKPEDNTAYYVINDNFFGRITV